MFIRVTDIKYNDEIIINIDNISCIHENSQTVLLNGVHGEGTGLYKLSKEDIKRIVSIIDIINFIKICLRKGVL